MARTWTTLLGGIPSREYDALISMGYPLHRSEAKTPLGTLQVVSGPRSLMAVIDEVRFNVTADLVEHVRTQFPVQRAHLRVVRQAASRRWGDDP